MPPSIVAQMPERGMMLMKIRATRLLQREACRQEWRVSHIFDLITHTPYAFISQV